jgi:hypothetical protein
MLLDFSARPLRVPLIEEELRARLPQGNAPCVTFAHEALARHARRVSPVADPRSER